MTRMIRFVGWVVDQHRAMAVDFARVLGRIFTALSGVRVPPWKHKGLWWQR